MTIKDLRGQYPLPYDPKKFRLGRDKMPVKRKPSEVDTVVVHQTACVFGPKADVEKRHRRGLLVPYHTLSFTDGVTVLGHDALEYTYHANAWNARSLGFAVEGEFPAFMGKETSRHTPYTELQADGARRGLKALVEMARAQGCPVTRFACHRQSSANRAGDPGQYWFRLLSRFARDELGLVVVDRETLGDGLPVPLEWL